MKIIKYFYIIMLIIFCSCEQEDDFNATKLSEIFNLTIEGNNASSDGVSKIQVIADFPKDFNTENDNKVEFTVYKDAQETTLSEIILTERNGVNSKVATLIITHNKATSIKVQATIKVNDITVTKEVEITFKKAYLDTINVKSSSLIITPNSFNEIEITTELLRNTGQVSLNSTADTKVVDPTGTLRGIFNNYQNTTNSEGKIINNFTLGNDTYEGLLYVISTSLNEQNEIKKDTLTLFSQN